MNKAKEKQNTLCNQIQHQFSIKVKRILNIVLIEIIPTSYCVFTMGLEQFQQLYITSLI